MAETSFPFFQLLCNILSNQQLDVSIILHMQHLAMSSCTHLLPEGGDLPAHLDVVVADNLVVLVDRRLEHLPHPLPLDPHPQQVTLLQELVHTLTNLKE